VGAVQLVAAGAQVSGQIKKLHIDVGQEVKKGDLIAELDSVPQINQLETDRALLESYQAQLQAKKISLRMAESQYSRAKNLRARDAASQESLENLENAHALAKAEVAVLESQIRQTMLAVSTDEVNLGYTRITSPLDGTVVSVPVDEGQTVNAAQTTPTIAQIADLQRMEIKVEISEGDITAVKPGLPITYTILSEPDETRQAVLTSIDPGLTTLTDGTYKTASATSSSGSSSEAVYYYGKALIDNSDGRLRIGMTTQTDIVVASAENALLAPLMAVNNEPGGKKSVRVLMGDGTVATREVSVGMNDGVHVQIRNGLQAGEKVITGLLSQDEIKAQSRRRRLGPF
jgi:macrolide-specific efflux system membrane fusion protein